MEVVLLKDVARIGKSGEKVSVKDGFGRNFLIPQGLAVPAASGADRSAQAHLSERIRSDRRAQEKAQEQARKVEGVPCIISAAVGAQGKLHGAVTAADIARALEGQGVRIDKHQVELERPITQVGETEVVLRLHAQVKASVRVHVVAGPSS